MKNSGQWATMAILANEIITAIAEQVEKERKEKLIGNNNATKEKTTGQLIAQSFANNTKNYEESKTATKVAEMFNTNKTYIKEAARLKENNPEAFEQVKNGLKTLTEVKKEEKIQ
jgi:hypothetical protein